MFSLILVAIICVFIFWLIAIFNGLVKRSNQVSEAWADIDVQLKRRYDLIPNLVESVKGYATHEKELFEKVTVARNQAMGAKNAQEKAAAENALTDTLKSLFAVAEAYPDLKANQNFLELQRELTDTEDKIQASRRFYNGNVRDYNIAIELFPARFFVGLLGFKKKDLFEITDLKEKEPVKVSF